MTQIPSFDEYKQNEVRKFRAEYERIQKEPEVGANGAQFYVDCVKDPELVAERIGWLLNGTYGFAEQYTAGQILNNKRMNQVAALSQMIAVIEWQTSTARAREEWKNLTKDEQKKLDSLIRAEIKAYWENQEIVKDNQI